MKLNIFFIVILFLTGCNKPEAKISEDSSIWIKDSLGCMNKRNKDLAEKLIHENKLERSSVGRFKELFGIWLLS
ncbi:hypothetical protein [Chryseobacterium sp. M5A1_1a]